MGFNATRRYKGPKTVDVLLLIAGIVLIGGLLIWAMSG